MRRYDRVDDIARRQARLGGKTALRHNGRDTSYAAVDERSNRIAQGLVAAGVRSGDRVATLCRNTADYFAILFGALKAEAVLTPVNWRLATPEILWILTDAACPVLFVADEFAGQIADNRDALPDLELVIGLDTDALGPRLDDWMGGFPAHDPEPSPDPEAIALQIYTSGTTGRPKGAMLSHRALLSYRALPADQQPAWNDWRADDVSLLVMPIFHIGGTGFGLTTLAEGATGLIVSDFVPAQVLEFIETEGLSKIFTVPSAIQMLLREPRANQIDYSRIRTIVYGAAPMPVELLREAMGVFRCGFVQQYGMTESCGTVSVLLAEEHDPAGHARMRSVGRAMETAEIVILDEAGRPLPRGSFGEIAIRSPTLMSGYWNRPDLTAAAMTPDGFFRTGDGGHIDEDGFIFLTDRLKDLIVSGGENIYPAEVEQALTAHEAVDDAAVIGVPSERWGEAAHAVVVLKPGAIVTEAELIAWARERLAGYKLPKSVAFADRLPRNHGGKLLRRELRDPFWRGTGRTL
jgi:acyl-CoA synthetase (AMP-forming)/AMP-acid ligase II